MPRVKGTPKRHSMKAAEHSAKKERQKTHGNRHQIWDISQLKRVVQKAELGDTITLQTDNQMGVQTWRVKMGLKPNGKYGKKANLISTYDYEYSDSDKTASEEGDGSEETSSRGGKSRRRKSRKSRKTRKSFYNWS